MKTLTVRLPESLALAIEEEARLRKISRSDVVRDRLRRASTAASKPGSPAYELADLIGSVDGLAADLSARKKGYLRASVDDRERHC